MPSGMYIVYMVLLHTISCVVVIIEYLFDMYQDTVLTHFHLNRGYTGSELQKSVDAIRSEHISMCTI